MELFNFSYNVFGLDIGDLTFKAVLLKKHGKKIQLQKYGEQIVPKDYFLNGEIKQPEKVANFTKQFLKKLDISTPYVIAVLPETKTFIKMIEIPCSEKDRILENIKKEIELYVPFKLNEVYFDWQKISGDGGRIKILVGLAPKNIVDSYLNTLKLAGLTPLALEIESIAILRALVDDQNLLQPKIILDLGATRSSLIIIDEGFIQLTISLPLAGADLTEKIAQELKVEFWEAKKIKDSYQDSEKNMAVEKLISSFLTNLAKSVKNHIKFYEDNSQRKIEELILCGGGASLLQGIAIFEKELNIKVRKGNPWISILNKNISLSETDSLRYTTAIGLALRGLKEKI